MMWTMASSLANLAAPGFFSAVFLPGALGLDEDEAGFELLFGLLLCAAGAACWATNVY